jgi:hypothetical protein
MCRSLQLLLILVVLMSGVVRAPAEQLSVDGTWVGTLRTDYGRADITFRFVQVGEKVDGTYDVSGPGGSFFNVKLDGSLRGERLDLVVGPTHDTIRATVKNDQLNGVFMGSTGAQTLNARRRKW